MRAAYLSLAAIDATVAVSIVACVRAVHPRGWEVMVVVACVVVGAMGHVLGPGWILPRAPLGLHALRIRVLCGYQALFVALVAMVGLLVTMVAVGAAFPLAGLVLFVATPVIAAAIAALGAAWAHVADPRTRAAAPRVAAAEGAAVAGAVLAWVPSALWALTPMPPGWGGIPALIVVASWALVAGAIPVNRLVVRRLARGDMLASPVVMVGRAGLVCVPLGAASVVLLLAGRS